MLRNQAQALLRHERIRTTVPRAKELRPFVERLITIAKRGLASGENGRVVYARRLVRRDLADQTVVSKLFDGIAPRFASRPGGYTRLLRVGRRRGDAAEMAQVELVGSEYSPETSVTVPVEEMPQPTKAKGVAGRLRAAARRIRGGAKASAGDDTEKRKKRADGDTDKKAGTKKKAAARKKSSE